MINKKRVSALVLSVMLVLSGVSYAASQYSYATIDSTSISVEGNQINGGDGTLTGALRASGGEVEVAAYKVLAWYPDERVDRLFVSTTKERKLEGVELEAYENLFYVKLTRNSGAPSAWGQLESVH